MPQSILNIKINQCILQTLDLDLLLSSLKVIDLHLVQVPGLVLRLPTVVMPDAEEGERAETRVDTHHVVQDGSSGNMLGGRYGLSGEMGREEVIQREKGRESYEIKHHKGNKYFYSLNDDSVVVKPS